MPKRGIITVVRDVVRPALFGGWKQESGAQDGGQAISFVNTGQAVGVNKTLVASGNYESQVAANKGVIHAALNIVSSMVGANPMRVYRVRQKGQKAFMVTRTRDVLEPRKTELLRKASAGSALSLANDVEEIVAGHRLVDLLANVNAIWDSYQLKYTTVAYMILVGTAYWVLIKDRLGIPTAIWLAPSEYMRIKPAPDGLIAGYTYKHGTLTKNFDADEVVYFRNPAPGAAYQYYGRGSLMGAMDDFNLMQNVLTFENAIFQHGGVPPLALSFGEYPKEEQIDSLRRQWPERYGGADKAGLPFIAGNVKVEKLGETPRELAYQSARKVLLESMAANIGVPIAMLTNQVNSRAALDASLTQVAMVAVQPFCTLIQEALNAQLTPRYSDPVQIAFDDPVPEDKEFIAAQEKNDLDGGITAINEVRRQRGLPPVEGGDTPYINMNRIPLGSPIPESAGVSQSAITDIVGKALAEAKARVQVEYAEGEG